MPRFFKNPKPHFDPTLASRVLERAGNVRAAGGKMAPGSPGGDLRKFLEPLAPVFGRRDRFERCVQYVAGILRPGDRNSVRQIAANTGGNAESLHHFVNQSPWNHGAVLERLRAWACQQKTRRPTVLILHECLVRKRSRHALGVARHHNEMSWDYYFSPRADGPPRTLVGQLAPTWFWTDGPTCLPVATQLYLPPLWANRTGSLKAAGVPARAYRSADRRSLAMAPLAKAVDQLPPVRAVVFDTYCGGHFQFLANLEHRNVPYLAQVRRHHPPVAPTKCYAVPASVRRSRRLWWTSRGLGYKKWLLQVTASHERWLPFDGPDAKGLAQALFAEYLDTIPLVAGSRTPPKKRWIIFVRDDAEDPDVFTWDAYVSNLHAETRPTEFADLIRLFRTTKANQTARQSRLGIGHFEGRSWRGIHHHLILSLLAGMFLGEFNRPPHGLPKITGCPRIPTVP